MNVNNANAILRLTLSALLGLAGIALMVKGALENDQNQFAVGSTMLAGCGLTAWDSPLASPPPPHG